MNASRTTTEIQAVPLRLHLNPRPETTPPSVQEVAARRLQEMREIQHRYQGWKDPLSLRIADWHQNLEQTLRRNCTNRLFYDIIQTELPSLRQALGNPIDGALLQFPVRIRNQVDETKTEQESDMVWDSDMLITHLQGELLEKVAFDELELTDQVFDELFPKTEDENLLPNLLRYFDNHQIVPLSLENEPMLLQTFRNHLPARDMLNQIRSLEREILTFATNIGSDHLQQPLSNYFNRALRLENPSDIMARKCAYKLSFEQKKISRKMEAICAEQKLICAEETRKLNQLKRSIHSAENLSRSESALHLQKIQERSDEMWAVLEEAIEAQAKTADDKNRAQAEQFRQELENVKTLHQEDIDRLQLEIAKLRFSHQNAYERLELEQKTHRGNRVAIQSLEKQLQAFSWKIEALDK